MQINTDWLPKLRPFGITEHRLREECVSIHVGAWILANNMQQHGGLSWTAVGAYNVGCLKLPKQECERRRNAYSWRVFRALQAQGQPQVRPVQQMEMARTASIPTQEVTPAQAPSSRIAVLSFDP
jgi:hypothetical protein